MRVCRVTLLFQIVGKVCAEGQTSNAIGVTA